jgi:hypothetical protein
MYEEAMVLEYLVNGLLVTHELEVTHEWEQVMVCLIIQENTETGQQPTVMSIVHTRLYLVVHKVLRIVL